ncbi:hypothetical protein [Mycolicibacterium sphagni]|uniref:hypothetical protein n=1 Tax=Mycolicibacterium sphagni TaxID=1786 RepID=UPI0021F3C031|nr:hypothetical protein [Mycolicibacterium sphagni]MCV7174816.1 hypothetical protein [Mycolicibacterium sphagni]
MKLWRPFRHRRWRVYGAWHCDVCAHLHWHHWWRPITRPTAMALGVNLDAQVWVCRFDALCQHEVEQLLTSKSTDRRRIAVRVPVR